MNEYDIAEQAYKNGYEQGMKDCARQILDEISKHYDISWLIELYECYEITPHRRLVNQNK